MKQDVELPGEHEYLLNRFAHIQLEGAGQCLAKMDTVEDGFIRHSLFLNAIIAYCRPFTKCGILKNGKRVQKVLLDRNVVPGKHLELHKQLLDARHQEIAHTDIDVRAPVLHAWTTMNPMRFPMVFKTGLIGGLFEQAPVVASLVNEVRQHVERRMADAEAAFDMYIGELKRKREQGTPHRQLPRGT